METRFDTNEIRGSGPEKPRKVNLFETRNLFVDVHVLAPGQVAKVHAHEREDKCYIVLDGRPTIVCGEDEAVCEPGQGVFCPTGVPHGVRNDGPDEARLLVTMAPHPRPEAIGGAEA